jgi:hypothetical protein
MPKVYTALAADAIAGWPTSNTALVTEIASLGDATLFYFALGVKHVAEAAKASMAAARDRCSWSKSGRLGVAARQEDFPAAVPCIHQGPVRRCIWSVGKKQSGAIM